MKYLARALGQLRDRFPSLPKYPEMVAKVTPAQLGIVAKNYQGALAKGAGVAKRITDKLLTNYFFLGLINLMFPNAKVIHTRRDPVDIDENDRQPMAAEGGGQRAGSPEHRVGRLGRGDIADAFLQVEDDEGSVGIERGQGHPQTLGQGSIRRSSGATVPAKLFADGTPELLGGTCRRHPAFDVPTALLRLLDGRGLGRP